MLLNGVGTFEVEQSRRLKIGKELPLMRNITP